MKYFDKDYISFFKDLAKNNNKEWFHANKKRYEASVKKPFLHFVTDLIREAKIIDPAIDLDPRKCISRINRDIRFAKDKTPYNLHLHAHITKGHPKINPEPVIAVRFTAQEAGIMSGHWMPSKERLKSIRDQIKNDPKAFRKKINAKSFVEKFGKVLGDAHKRIPPEYRDIYEIEPLIANKQFYYVARFKPTIIFQDDLMSTVIAHCKAARPVNEFLTAPLH